MTYSLRLLFSLVLAMTTSFPLFSAEKLPSDMRLGAEHEPLATAYDCVNLISGAFFLTDSSLVIDGPAPLSYSSFYDNGYDYLNGRGFGFGVNLPLRLGNFFEPRNSTSHLSLLAEDRESAALTYNATRKKDGTIEAWVDPTLFEEGYTNHSEGMTGAESVKNRRLRFTGVDRKYEGGQCEMILGSGAVRTYNWFKRSKDYKGFWHLKGEKNPNCRKVIYDYNDRGRLIRLQTANSAENIIFNSIDILDQPNGYSLQGSNGQSTRYVVELLPVKYGRTGKELEKMHGTRHFLTKIIPSHAPEVSLKYHAKRPTKDGLWSKLLSSRKA